MKPKADRNAAVVRARKSGKTLREVADEFGITIDRVRQIVLRYDFTPAPKPVKQRKRAKASDADRQHLLSVKSLPCCICGAPPPSDAHHCIVGRFSQKKAPHRETIPLCKRHHQHGPEAIHQNKRLWVELHGPDTDYINETINKIYGGSNGNES